MKHGNVLEVAVGAGIEPLDLHPEVGSNMRLLFKRHDLNALVSTFAKQQRGQAAVKAFDTARRLTVRRRNARSVAGARTMPHGSAARNHDTPENAKAAGLKAE